MPRKKNKYHLLIEKFIKNTKVLKPKDWARETKIAKKLYDKFDNEIFWKRSFLDFKLNSLAWLLSKDGLEYLSKEYLILKVKLPQQKEIKLENKIYGTQKKVDKKPRNVLDFINSEKQKNDS